MTLSPLRQIPGYPRIDRDNDYLLARIDGAVLDGKPWGHGTQEPGYTLALHPRNSAEAALSRLEVRDGRGAINGGGEKDCGLLGELPATGRGLKAVLVTTLLVSELEGNRSGILWAQ